jgi:hypothetical protein
VRARVGRALIYLSRCFYAYLTSLFQYESSAVPCVSPSVSLYASRDEKMELREMIYHFRLASCRSSSDEETQRRRIAVDARDARMVLKLAIR